MHWSGMKVCGALIRVGLRALLRAGTIAAMVGISGCAASGLQAPKTRIGALPFPGIASLYAAADPEGVTPHRYAGGLQTMFLAEGDRGIIYTTRAGFIDMAHVRQAMDWTWYLTRLIEASEEVDVDEGVRVVRFTHECVRGELRVPTGLSEVQRAQVAAMAAHRLLTWHEVSTWYGYSLVPMVSERRSTFTVDDSTSHVLGAGLGREVAILARTRAEYDEAADVALEGLMREYGAMEPSETTRMCAVVKGVWWEGGRARVFDANVAILDGDKRPLLAMECGGVELGVPLAGLEAGGLPELGRWWKLEVSGVAARGVERVLGTRVVRGDADLARLVEDVAGQLAMEEGVRVVRDADVAELVGVEHARLGE